jgi:heme/copper-type cytochrome/quinol oxidase subunit 3
MLLVTKPDHRPPPYTATFGLWLFLSSLMMLFAATILGYLVIRFTSRNAPPLHTLTFPAALWASTALVLAGSVAIHRALACVRRERQQPFRTWMVVALLCAVGFVAVQAPSLWLMLTKHFQQARENNIQLYGLVFFLVVVHALHVLGGIIQMFNVTLNAFAGKYDHESHGPVKHAAMYWHFLDVVWIVMFGTLILVG